MYELSVQIECNVLFSIETCDKIQLNPQQKVPYRAVYPDALEKDWKLPKRDGERTLNVLQLRDANIEPSQLWDSCEGITDDAVDDEEEGEGVHIKLLVS